MLISLLSSFVASTYAKTTTLSSTVTSVGEISLRTIKPTRTETRTFALSSLHHIVNSSGSHLMCTIFCTLRGSMEKDPKRTGRTDLLTIGTHCLVYFNQSSFSNSARVEFGSDTYLVSLSPSKSQYFCISSINETNLELSYIPRVRG